MLRDLSGAHASLLDGPYLVRHYQAGFQHCWHEEIMAQARTTNEPEQDQDDYSDNGCKEFPGIFRVNETPNKLKKVRHYFDLMTKGEIEQIIDLFEGDARIDSPFLGRMNAAEFFRKLGNASRESKLTVFDVLIGEDGTSAAAHFEYDWTLASGEVLHFQGIDYFRFGQFGKFASMSIFYDTHPLRQEVGDKYANA